MLRTRLICHVRARYVPGERKAHRHFKWRIRGRRKGRENGKENEPVRCANSARGMFPETESPSVGVYPSAYAHAPRLRAGIPGAAEGKRINPSAMPRRRFNPSRYYIEDTAVCDDHTRRVFSRVLYWPARYPRFIYE